MPPRPALRAPGSDPQDHPPRMGKGRRPPRSAASQSCRTKPVWGSGCWAGAGQRCLVGSVKTGSQRVLEEQWESSGERAALPSHQPPSPPPRLAPPALCCSPSLASERGKSQHNSWSIPLPDNLRTQHLLDTGWTLGFNSAFTPSRFAHSKFGCYSGSWTRWSLQDHFN